MKSSTKHEVKGKSYEVKGKTKERWVKLMNDPTLEGRDENKVGRIQERIVQGENPRKMAMLASSSDLTGILYQGE